MAEAPSSETLPSPQVFSTTPGMLALLAITAAGIVAGGGFLAYLALTSDGGLWWLALVGVVAGLAILVYAWLVWKKERVEIHAGRIEYTTVFRTRSLAVGEIKGFQILVVKSTRFLLLIPSDPKVGKLKVPLALRGGERIEMWARNLFRDLDAEHYQADLEAILANDEYGYTLEERQAFLGRFLTVAKWINMAGAGVLLWVLLYPNPYEWAIWTALLAPLSALVAGIVSRGLVRPLAAGSVAAPNVAATMLGVPAILALRAGLDWNLLDLSTVWAPVAVGMVACAAACLASFRASRRNPTHLAVLALVCAAYAYGATIALNGLLDGGTAKAYRAQVLRKHISTGKHTSYLVELGPWGPRTEAKEVDVDEQIYDALGARDPAEVYVMPGRLGIPWFVVYPAADDDGEGEDRD